MGTLQPAQIQEEKAEAQQEVADILGKLENLKPGVTEGASALVGSSIGAAGSLGALSALGTTGLSAAGITSGLATAGLGGGMIAGLGVLAAPVAILGIGAYAVAKHRKDAALSAALGEAVTKIYNIIDRLSQNAQYFKEEIAGLRTLASTLARQKKK